MPRYPIGDDHFGYHQVDRKIRDCGKTDCIHSKAGGNKGPQDWTLEEDGFDYEGGVEDELAYTNTLDEEGVNKYLDMRDAKWRIIYHKDFEKIMEAFEKKINAEHERLQARAQAQQPQ